MTRGVSIIHNILCSWVIKESTVTGMRVGVRRRGERMSAERVRGGKDDFGEAR